MRVGGELTGQVAIVTGAAAGIGRAVLEMLAAEGARVVALDIDAAGAAQAVAALTTLAAWARGKR
ncbi:MAG: SDR family NAD(P)-dependent oxidoreductase [Alphaproteobacteria bacterium]